MNLIVVIRNVKSQNYKFPGGNSQCCCQNLRTIHIQIANIFARTDQKIARGPPIKSYEQNKINYFDS